MLATGGKISFYIDKGRTTREIDPPLVLYRNRSNPNGGWILYWGAFKSSRTSGVTSEDREDYQVDEDYRDKNIRKNNYSTEQKSSFALLSLQ